MWRIDDPQCNESQKIKYDIVPYTRGKGLDLGCGPYKTYNHFIGVDNGHHWGLDGVDVKVETCERLDLFANQSMDFVFSSHLLEHINDAQRALKEWWRVIKPGGYLVLYLPHEDLYPKLGEPGANPDHKHNLNELKVIEWMENAVNGFDLVVNEYRDQDYGAGQQGNEYSFLQIYKKRSEKNNISSYLIPKPKKTVCVVRYGGIGDMMQASSVFPALKKQGFHVTVMTTPHGKQVVENDPHIDDFIIQDRDQVPNSELTKYWQVWAKRFTKFINLSESTEGTLLSMPNKASFYWPHDVRHKYLDVNYLEFVHDLAGIPYNFSTAFYPTEIEKKWAAKQREGITEPIIIWSLNGSSVHKTWPYMDNVIARLLMQTNVHIFLIGDNFSQMLEAGWEDEPRVHQCCGKWSIRQTLTFVKEQADIVFGPETGVLNAVSLEGVRKIVLLSHSSKENLTKHWVNTTTIEPVNMPCYPCHKMHYSFDTCVRAESGAGAACQSTIEPDQVYKPIRDILISWQQAAVKTLP